MKVRVAPILENFGKRQNFFFDKKGKKNILLIYAPIYRPSGSVLEDEERG